MHSKKYQVNLSKKAEKAFVKIRADYRKLIQKSLLDISDDPYVGDVIKLKGEINTYRKRVGIYRIIYSIYQDIVYVEVLDISHRKDTYK